MKRAAQAACAVLCLVCGGVLTAAAQCPAENTAFKSGEYLEYDLYYNWKFIWLKAGTATLATDSVTYEGRPAYCFDMLSISSKRLDFFFKMRDTLTCYVSPRLEPIYFRKAAEEGKRYTVDEAWFTYRNDSAFVHQLRTYRDGNRIETDYQDTDCVFDMLSILAQARSWNGDDFEVGDKVHFPMATGRRVEQQTLIYRGKENIEANNGVTYRCLVFSFVEYDKKGKEQEVITFFVSDDRNHLPIRLDMYLNIGSAKAFLKGIKNNRYPLDSAVGEE